jgi:hypothetical protein
MLPTKKAGTRIKVAAFLLCVTVVVRSELEFESDQSVVTLESHVA